MRSSSQTELIKVDENAQVMGIMLGHNYCAEHEWGIDTLRRVCNGMSKEEIDQKRVCSFKRIRIKVAPADLIWYEEKDLAILGVNRDIKYIRTRFNDATFLKNFKFKGTEAPEFMWAKSANEFGIPEKLTKKHDKLTFKPLQTLSAWDSDSFGITSRDPEVIAFMKDLREALLSGDAVMHISTTKNPFKPVSGLVLAIESRVPQEQKDAFKEAFEDHYKLADAAEKTGIKKKLEKAGKRFFALSPSWLGNMKERITGHDAKGEAIVTPVNTKHSVMFWLNPYDQRANNSMWCTVEDLEAWINNEGPIPMKGLR